MYEALKPIKDWDALGMWIDVPRKRRESIRRIHRRDPERKRAMFEELLEHHPAPSWHLIARALYILAEPLEHRLLKTLYEKYVTGMYMSVFKRERTLYSQYMLLKLKMQSHMTGNVTKTAVFSIL